MLTIGIDNGVTGTIGIISDTEAVTFHVPQRKCRNYQKDVRFISRVDILSLKYKLNEYMTKAADDEEIRILIERPMVNPARFNASTSALRALEATLIVLESLQRSYPRLILRFIDSKEWQTHFFGKHDKDDLEDLKILSLRRGCELYPGIEQGGKFSDLDGLLIARYARQCEIKEVNNVKKKKKKPEKKSKPGKAELVLFDVPV